MTYYYDIISQKSADSEKQRSLHSFSGFAWFLELYTKEFISKTTYIVIPACLESFFKKDAGQAGMTK